MALRAKPAWRKRMALVHALSEAMPQLSDLPTPEEDTAQAFAAREQYGPGPLDHGDFLRDVLDGPLDEAF